LSIFGLSNNSILKSESIKKQKKTIKLGELANLVTMDIRFGWSHRKKIMKKNLKEEIEINQFNKEKK
jgi:hypothetical protein